MRPPIHAAILMFVAACGNAELDALEKEQAELRTRVDQLRTELGVLRGDMVDAGLISAKQAKMRTTEEAAGPEKAGKARRRGDDKVFGHPLPTNDLSDVLSFTASRTGTPPELPALSDLERSDTPCGHKFVIRELQALSDYPLNSAGFGKSGPLLLLENGEPLTPHATPAEFDEQCAGAFRHAGYAFLFSPTGDAASAATNTYTLAHAEDVPLPRGDDGRPMYWVYPGTTLTLSVDGGWDESWGEMTVSVGGRVATPSDISPKVRVAGEQLDVPVNARPNQFAVERAIAAPPSGPWKLEIESPDDGPYVLLGTVTIGNAEHALVITAEEAFAATGGE